VEELRRLPPIAWLLIVGAAVLGFVLFWAWSWYRNYRARKALHGAVTGGAECALRSDRCRQGSGG